MPNTSSVTVLFADIAHSTQIYEKLGDKSAQTLIQTCLSTLSEITKYHKGIVIKTIGDEVMCTFPDADSAFNASLAMQQAVDKMPLDDFPGLTHINIYIGFHHGNVITEENDVFGDAVNVAARLVAFAKQRQIVTSEQTVMEFSREYRDSVRHIDRTTVKGKSEAINIYEVIWEQTDLTIMSESDSSSLSVSARLEVSMGEKFVIVDINKPVVTLGRLENNDVVVDDITVSRAHARIELHRGKFMYIDQSLNGSYITPQGKKRVRIKRDEIPLVGSGIIGLGRKVNPDSPLAVHYNIIYDHY